jgi:hypothetical protein
LAKKWGNCLFCIRFAVVSIRLTFRGNHVDIPCR